MFESGNQSRTTLYTVVGYRPTALLFDVRNAVNMRGVTEFLKNGNKRLLDYFEKYVNSKGFDFRSVMEDFGTHYRNFVKSENRIQFSESFHNLVVTAGLNDALDKHFKASSYTAAWYVMLTGTTPTPNAADTMSSHAGWSEFVNYDEATRPTLTLGTVSSGSVDNSASTADVTISTNGSTIGGAAITTNNTKSGTTGTLYSVGAFSAGDKGLDDGDTLSVTATLTATAS